MTQTAAVIGTAQYLSPEQARGESVDARSDVYSTGCLLFELLTGRPPFTGDSPVAVAYQHVREDPRPPSSINPDVAAGARRDRAQGAGKNPANRYQSAAEMRADLLRALAGQRVEATPVMGDAEKTTILGAPRRRRTATTRRRRLGRRGRHARAPPAADHRDRRRAGRALLGGAIAARSRCSGDDDAAGRQRSRCRRVVGQTEAAAATAI